MYICNMCHLCNLTTSAVDLVLVFVYDGMFTLLNRHTRRLTYGAVRVHIGKDLVQGVPG